MLGWPAICALHVFANINPIFKSAESVKSLFPEVFLGLGKLGEPYTIKLTSKQSLFVWKRRGEFPYHSKKRILYTSPKNTFQKIHFPEKHLAETTLSRIYISLNVHFPEITFP